MDLNTTMVMGYMSNYLLTFIFCFIGAFIKETRQGLKGKNKISFINAFTGSILSAFIACAIAKYINLNRIEIYACACVSLGMFGSRIVELMIAANDKNIILNFLKNVFKESSNIILKAIGNSIQEQQDESKRKSEARKKNNKKNNENSSKQENSE